MMRMKTCKVVLCLLLMMYTKTKAQNIHNRIDNAMQQLLKDEQMKHAIMSLYVVNSNTNEVVYDLNSQYGLAPASCQKVFTASAAFDLLGEKYQYKTMIGYDGEIVNGLLHGNLYVVGSGDPSFGSWCFASTKRAVELNKILSAIKKTGINAIDGDIIVDGSKFSYQPIPGGWIWDDIGNYYGAGTWSLNWNENQYDLILKPGKKENDTVTIEATDPELSSVTLFNQITTGKAGSGDNGYIYMAPYATNGFTEGTVPAGEKTFTISGSMPNPSQQFSFDLQQYFTSNNINITGSYKTASAFISNKQTVPSYKTLIDSVQSPTLDSLIYWFLQKSINLYGEAFIKTISYNKNNIGSTDDGVEILRNFWADKGIDKSAIHIIDGSGLSPQNRVTTQSLVQVLQYAHSRKWYNYFLQALPIYNGIKMKSGTIGGTKSFTGYQTSKQGVAYTFAIIINNYDGSSAELVRKMYNVLDELKK
jgi:D-alanyl-D-alanine carboxypeptidase/D-alanyl-D-alanine-endopeptidase (penicillin-binding protein 4)